MQNFCTPSFCLSRGTQCGGNYAFSTLKWRLRQDSVSTFHIIDLQYFMIVVPWQHHRIPYQPDQDRLGSLLGLFSRNLLGHILFKTTLSNSQTLLCVTLAELSWKLCMSTNGASWDRISFANKELFYKTIFANPNNNYRIAWYKHIWTVIASQTLRNGPLDRYPFIHAPIWRAHLCVSILIVDGKLPISKFVFIWKKCFTSYKSTKYMGGSINVVPLNHPF